MNLLSQLLINLLFGGLQVSNLVIEIGILDTLDKQFTLNQVGALNLAGSLSGDPKVE